MLLLWYLLIQGKLANHLEEHLVEALNLFIALQMACSSLAFLYAELSAQLLY